MLSIVIPSCNERFLEQTIRDVLQNTTGDIEVYPILDGYTPPEYVDDKRVHYIQFKDRLGKRQGINTMVAVCKGEYVMSLDAHCMVAPGFDEVLTRDCEDNMVMIPRRHRLDADNWCLQVQSDDRPPIDYEYFMYPDDEPKGLHGFKWDKRTLERMEIPIDDTLTFQGSCWVMTKDHFIRNKFMDYTSYENWGQEAEEIGLTTRLNGGRVVTNKNTWYAHLHKGPKYGRMYFLDRNMTRKTNAYSYDLWVNQHRDFFVDLIKSFMPVPGWSEDSTKWIL